MNLIQLASLSSKLGINVNLAAIGSILPLLDKKAHEVTSDDVAKLSNLIGFSADPDSEAVSKVVELVQTSNFDVVSDLLSSDEDVTKIAHYLMYNEERIGKKLSRDLPLIPVKCDCGEIGKIDRATAIGNAKPNGYVTYTCLSCDRTRELSVKSIRTFGL